MPADPEPAHLDDIDLAAGWACDRSAPIVPEVAPRDPRAVLEEEVLRGLQRSPCVVAFSGGCDSGGILCLAVHVARREGLPDPIPMVTDARREMTLADLRYWNAGVLVLTPQKHDVDMLRVMSDILGAKPTWTKGAWIWDVRRLVDDPAAHLD